MSTSVSWIDKIIKDASSAPILQEPIPDHGRVSQIPLELSSKHGAKPVPVFSSEILGFFEISEQQYTTIHNNTINFRSIQNPPGDANSPRMWVLKISDFMTMSGAPVPFEELQEQGLLHEWDPSLFTILVSHEWLGRDHPDVKGYQSHCLRMPGFGQICFVYPSFFFRRVSNRMPQASR